MIMNCTNFKDLHRLIRAARIGLAYGMGAEKFRKLTLATETPPSWWAQPDAFAEWKKRNASRLR